MIKKTLYFGNPVRLNTTNQQLVITKTDQESLLQNTTPISIPIEDIGIVVFDNPQITFTHNLMQLLIENNTAIITCNKQHLPVALTLNLAGNTLQTEKYKEQIEATVPLKKQLWQQTIKQKIINQAYALQSTGKQGANKLVYLAD